MIDTGKTIISQYANSPTICSLIDFVNQNVDPRADIDSFYSMFFDVSTAVGVGLEALGRIVGITTRVYAGVTMGDEDFRALILLKAAANIATVSIPAMNKLMNSLFGTTGRQYVNDLGKMMIRYTFEYRLTAFQNALLNDTSIIFKPAGVDGRILSTTFPWFGFAEMGTRCARGFDQVPFMPEGDSYEIG